MPLNPPLIQGTTYSKQPFTPVVAGGTTLTPAAIAATLPAVTGVTNYLEGFDIVGGGATAGSIISVTITGLLGGTITMNLAVLAGAAVSGMTNGIFSARFPTPLPASGSNVAIAVNVPSFGAGNVGASVVAYGFTAIN